MKCAFLLLLAAGVGMLAIIPAADCKYSWDCDLAGPYPDNDYKANLKNAMAYLEENTAIGSVDAAYPPDNPSVYARAYCSVNPCRLCVRVARKSLERYCRGKVFGSTQISGTGTCSVYYGHYRF